MTTVADESSVRELLQLDQPRTTPGLILVSPERRRGRTVVACAIAEALAARGLRVGVMKPVSIDGRVDREGLVDPDSELLAHFARLDPRVGNLSRVAPIVLRATDRPPALVGGPNREEPDWRAIGRSLHLLDRGTDIILVEAPAGPMMPLTASAPLVTPIDLVQAFGYPVAIVAEPSGQEISRVALTALALRSVRARIAGLIVNRYRPDDPDPAIQAAREWLPRVARTQILCTVPEVEAPAQALDRERLALHDDIRAAVRLTDWVGIARPPLG